MRSRRRSQLPDDTLHPYPPAILSPLVCLCVYLYWKAARAFRKAMRRIELVDAIKNDYTTRAAIIELITEKMKDDSAFQQTVVSITRKGA